METSNNDLQQRINRWVNGTIQRHKERAKEERIELPNFHFPALDKENFLKLLAFFAEETIRQRGLQHHFIIDDYNREVIRQMYLWVTCSQDCAWDVRKGIYLGGKIGCGKTTLMTAFCKVLGAVSNRVMTILPAKDIYSFLQRHGVNSLSTCPLFIDELGREAVEVTDYGNRIRPFVDIMERRYETGALTLITSNFNLATLSRETDDNGNRLPGYGEYISERVQEMTNMVVLPGGSRRQTWQKDREVVRP